MVVLNRSLFTPTHASRGNAVLRSKATNIVSRIVTHLFPLVLHGLERLPRTAAAGPLLGRGAAPLVARVTRAEDLRHLGLLHYLESLQ